ncbi:hypothetical protein IQ22_02666 [Pseudomonas duriflava]|uniref:Uncharacterized protein n=1 Tax=Pseudomonas duriflava TaxID=459528 RepID=A0A562QB86_9PSED|nr:hypothetical protein [Pseudomonas duriflava]TWI53450.1 hypothetical protein IQ22_02666 [Pseudomonas duriflava]
MVKELESKHDADTALLMSVPLMAISVLSIISGLLCPSMASLGIGIVGAVAALTIQFHEQGKKPHSLLAH